MTAHVLVVAGTGSDVGKTSITLGLARALRRRGVRVRAAKVGPDFLDPMHLCAATGRSCLNLDLFMMGEAYVRGLVAEAALDADLILIEGVMGLFDGVEPRSSAGSTAEVARLLDAPIALVADASGQARSFAATVHGFANVEPGLRVAGVIANRVGSAGHAALLSEALDSLSLPPLIASIVAGALPHLSSRHLGLVAPKDDNSLEALADAVEAALPLDAVVRLAQPLSPECKALPVAARPALSLNLAVAEDAAFGFIYADFRERVLSRGVRWLPFSPLGDIGVPEDADAVFLPGGYPELHAAELSENAPLLSSLRQFAARRPVYAECGGLMLLGESLLDQNGTRHEMAGILPLSTCVGHRLARLGYCEVTLTRDSLWGLNGEHCRGHEFHYSSLEAEPNDALERCYRLDYRKGPTHSEGFQFGRTLASYVHLHLSSNPERLEHFLEELAR
ncbi:MAG TPA: cobyrinate a,c-diamide synthase [Polyangiaceae bacterium]